MPTPFGNYPGEHSASNDPRASREIEQVFKVIDEEPGGVSKQQPRHLDEQSQGINQEESK